MKYMSNRIEVIVGEMRERERERESETRSRSKSFRPSG